MKESTPQNEAKNSMASLTIRLKLETRDRLNLLATEYDLAPTTLARQMIEHCISQIEEKRHKKTEENFIYNI